MKIYILFAKENWITDVLAKEWIQHHPKLYTPHLKDADIIWILSNYCANQILLPTYKQKKVITTIHHIVPWKMTPQKIKHFKYLNDITDVFMTNQDICKNTLSHYYLR